MRIWRSRVILAGLISPICAAFQASQVVRTRTASALFYQIRTDSDNQKTGNLYYADELLPEAADKKFGSFQNTFELLKACGYGWEGDDARRYSSKKADEELEEREPKIYDETIDYIEDGKTDNIVNPQLDLLKEWTQEYIDAIDLAGGFMTRMSVGSEELLAKDFVFTSPTIGPIGKQDFVNLMKYYHDEGLDLSSAVPDLSVSYEGWHQDPHEPMRVWAIARYSGTHIGTAEMPSSGLKLIPPNHGERPIRFTTGPELQSFLWTADKRILWQTMGYVGDSYTGSNQGHGWLDGLLVSMGLPHLFLKAIRPKQNVEGWLSQFKESGPRTKSSYSRLPQWWHERKTYELNIRR